LLSLFAQVKIIEEVEIFIEKSILMEVWNMKEFTKILIGEELIVLDQLTAPELCGDELNC
jgi:hypothetical protein